MPYLPCQSLISQIDTYITFDSAGIINPIHTRLSHPQTLIHIYEQMSRDVRPEIVVEPIGGSCTPSRPLGLVKCNERCRGDVVFGTPERDKGADMVSISDLSMVHVSDVGLVVPDKGGEVMVVGVVAVEGRFVGRGDVAEGD